MNRGYKVKVVKGAIMSRNPLVDVLAKYKRHNIAVTTVRELLEASQS